MIMEWSSHLDWNLKSRSLCQHSSHDTMLTVIGELHNWNCFWYSSHTLISIPSMCSQYSLTYNTCRWNCRVAASTMFSWFEKLPTKFQKYLKFSSWSRYLTPSTWIESRRKTKTILAVLGIVRLALKSNKMPNIKEFCFLLFLEINWC